MSQIKQFYNTTEIPFFVEVRNSLKLIDIEEDYDLLLSRPVGLLLAKLAEKLSFTPTTVSLFSLAFGVFGGFLLWFQNNLWAILLASACIVFSGFLDSSDGQLARRTKQYSQLGMIIDGFIDSLVFGSCYVFGSLYLLGQYNGWILGVAALSGFLHSLQSLVYDYYKNEFQFLVGHAQHYRNPDANESKKLVKNAKTFWEKILLFLYQDYTFKQRLLTYRSSETKLTFETFAKQDSKFPERYRQFNRLPLKLWALFGGTNTHRALILGFALCSRFDVYLIINIVLVLPMILVTRLQYQADKKLLLSLEK